MDTNVQESVQNNSTEFKKVYNEILTECISRRKQAGLSQDFMASWLNVDRRKIIEFEKGNGGVGLLLNYSDKLDIKVKLNYLKF